MKCIVVNPAELKDVWSLCSEFLSSAIAKSNGEVSLENVFRSIRTGESYLILIVDSTSDSNRVKGALVVEPKVFATGKSIAFVSLIGGEELAKWRKLALDKIEDLARQAGADEIYGTGRAGWGKVLASAGFKKLYSTFSKRV